MKSLFINFEVISSNIEEKSDLTDIAEIVMDLSAQKAAAVLPMATDKYDRPVVIGSDTIVVKEGEILGKPKSREEAKEMLKRLSGGAHLVYTGVSIQSQNGVSNFYEKTKVVFETINDELLEKYLDTGESMDKAGAYEFREELWPSLNL